MSSDGGFQTELPGRSVDQKALLTKGKKFPHFFYVTHSVVLKNKLIVTLASSAAFCFVHGLKFPLVP